MQEYTQFYLNYLLINNQDEFEKSIETSVKCLSLVGAIVLATLIIRMFFQRVTFDEHSTALIAQVLIIYSIGI